jgi:hypothetical protein
MISVVAFFYAIILCVYLLGKFNCCCFILFPSYKILQQMMVGWKESPRNAAAMPYFIWGLFGLIPGTA